MRHSQSCSDLRRRHRPPRLLLVFVAGEVDDVTTICSRSPFDVLIGGRLDLLEGDRHEMCLARRVLEVVGIAEGCLLLQLVFPLGQLQRRWRDDELFIRPWRRWRCTAATAATPSLGARGGEWVMLLVYPSSR
jgi:hypothetical protein